MTKLFFANIEIRLQNATLPHIKIKQGELKGTLESLSSGGSFASFKGIPYAKPPIGNLRFGVIIFSTRSHMFLSTQ